MSNDPNNIMKSLLAQLAEGGALSEEQAEAAFRCILAGEASQGQIGAFLMGLRQRGETISDITAGARVLRDQLVAVPTTADVIDTCGTGGDGSGSYNISTAVAFVVAACGVPVAKHGNRALSSKSGSSQVLEALGVALDLTPEQIGQCLDTTRMGFMFAPHHHAAMRHVGAVRQEMGIRTIFNLLGPLANPARAKRQLLGVFDEKWVVPLAETLRNLGSIRAWVVHGSDGMDELTTTGPSQIAELKDGHIQTFTLDAQDYGLARARADELAGGTPEENAEAMRQLFAGAHGAYRDIVVLNSAAALVVADHAQDIAEGLQQADQALSSGAAAKVLDQLAALTQSLAGK
jgi:anthranilate phosphoribosyltransferase